MPNIESTHSTWQVGRRCWLMGCPPSSVWPRRPLNGYAGKHPLLEATFVLGFPRRQW